MEPAGPAQSEALQLMNLDRPPFQVVQVCSFHFVIHFKLERFESSFSMASFVTEFYVKIVKNYNPPPKKKGPTQEHPVGKPKRPTEYAE